MRKALIVYGGWEGHKPEEKATLFSKILKEEDFDVELYDDLDIFSNLRKLEEAHLIVPIWTMGEIKEEQVESVSEAVNEGTGLAGSHGGMCDAFRENTEWQFLTGGQFVGHPGGNRTPATVNIKQSPSSPIVKGMEDFRIKTEHYYMHVDPAVEVLATVRFPLSEGPYEANGKVDMPVVWTKKWGEGRIFYCSLAHSPGETRKNPVSKLFRRGFRWASKIGKD